MIFLPCYNLIRHDCTGTCQGCSDCPLASEYLVQRLRTGRWAMIQYAFESWYDEWRFNQWAKKNSGYFVDQQIMEICREEDDSILAALKDQNHSTRM